MSPQPMALRMLVVPAAWAGLTLVGACAPAVGNAPRPTPSVSPAQAAGASPIAKPTYPAYYIESLRQLPHPGGQLTIGARMFRGAGYTKSQMTWPSQGQTMTGTISLPDGPGPFPVVVVNHGHIPVERYWIGQDSGIFGDPLSAHGFISVAPNYPGYADSGTLDPAYPAIIGQAVADMDLISSLATLPQADVRRVAMMGHSNGGGVTLLIAVIDPRVRALALFAPVSSDMADNSRKWWRGPSRGAAADPDTAPDAYAHISPRNYFSASTPPALFLQGTADEDIPAEWTNASVAALKSAGVATDIVWYPGARHDMVGSELADAVTRAESWVRRYLG